MDDRVVTSDKERGVRSYFWAKDSKHLLYVQDAGGNGVSVLTQKIGFDSTAGHIDYLATVKQAFDERFV